MNNKKQVRKIVFLSESDILNTYNKGNISKLRNLLITGYESRLSESDKKAIIKAIENDSIPDFMQCDPDYIRYADMGNYEDFTPGERGLPFEQLQIGNTCYIYSFYELPAIAQKILSEFFKSKFKMSFTCRENQTWKDFYSLKNAIAYRGRSGYTYTIWDYSSIRELLQVV